LLGLVLVTLELQHDHRLDDERNYANLEIPPNIVDAHLDCMRAATQSMPVASMRNVVTERDAGRRDGEVPTGAGACLPACLPACPPACPPACLPACLLWRSARRRQRSSLLCLPSERPNRDDGHLPKVGIRPVPCPYIASCFVPAVDAGEKLLRIAKGRSLMSSEPETDITTPQQCPTELQRVDA